MMRLRRKGCWLPVLCLLALEAAGCERSSLQRALLGSANASAPVAPASSVILEKKGEGAAASMAPMSFAPLVRSVDHGVVAISTRSEEVAALFFGGHRRYERQGLGSGFLIDKSGLVVTNNHVIERADSIVVKLLDGREFPAEVKGRDAPTDIAVLKIGGDGFAPLFLGDSEKIEVGDWVVAIGNPFGLSHTVTKGIVSAKGRTSKEVQLDPSGAYDFLQTDASINPGNSGGPLLNLKGEVVGVNTAIRGDAQGIGFAIPINMVKQLLPMLLRDGRVTRSALGVAIVDVEELGPEDRAEIGLTRDTGAVVARVEKGGPADKAGLLQGDVIVAFEGKPMEHSGRLRWHASTAGVGKTVTLGVVRRGKPLEVRVTLGKLPEQGVPGRPRFFGSP